VAATTKIVYVVDDDSLVRRSTTFFLSSTDISARPFASGSDFLDSLADLSPGCVLLDLRMPDIDGMQILERTGRQKLRRFPTIMITGHGDITTAVQAMQLGAIDFLEKPYAEQALLDSLERAFAHLTHNADAAVERERAQRLAATLSRRETEVLRGLISGRPNKVVAHDLDLSVRTVEMHRGKVMERLGVSTFSEAMRIAFLSGMDSSVSLTD
jgi:two-component system, LuxR family, response regulator FixJ